MTNKELLQELNIKPDYYYVPTYNKHDGWHRLTTYKTLDKAEKEESNCKNIGIRTLPIEPKFTLETIKKYQQAIIIMMETL